MHVIAKSLIESSAINNQDVPAGTTPVVIANDGCDAGVDTAQSVSTSRVDFGLDVGSDAVFLKNTTLGEELVDSAKHLRVDSTTFAAATDDDNVVFVADQVGTVSDGYMTQSN